MPEVGNRPYQYVFGIFPLSSYNVGRFLMLYLQLQEIYEKVIHQYKHFKIHFKMVLTLC